MKGKKKRPLKVKPIPLPIRKKQLKKQAKIQTRQPKRQKQLNSLLNDIWLADPIYYKNPFLLEWKGIFSIFLNAVFWLLTGQAMPSSMLAGNGTGRKSGCNIIAPCVAINV